MKSPYDLHEEDIAAVREQAAKLAKTSPEANPVDIVLLAIHQIRTLKWMQANRNPDGSKKEKPTFTGLFD